MIASNIVFVVSVLFVGAVTPSAIPMWEYLTQDEKIMYLYNMFQSQVKDFCETPTCKQELKNYGWNKLKNMPEDHLDKMDPFQRDSNNIIWESVMDGHHMMKTTEKSSSTTKFFEEKNTIKEENPDASIKLETSNKVPPPQGFSFNHPQYIIDVTGPEYKYTEPQYKYTEPQSSYADIYTSSNKIQEYTTEGIPIIESYGAYQRIPLTGPMVVKVHVDGTPVKDEKQSLPEDEDLKQYQLTKVVFQNL